MIDREKYEEYRHSLLNIIRLTEKKNSILINFDVDKESCRNVVRFIQQDGTTDILEDVIFVSNDTFYKEFLEKFIVDYYNNMVVAFNDSIDMNVDGKYTYRIITDDNDMLTIDGISNDYAKHLTTLVERTKQKMQLTDNVISNEDGVVNVFATALLIGATTLAFLVTFLLLG